MKRLLVSIILVLICAAVFAQTQPTGPINLETTRSLFSLDVGFAGDRNGGRGYSVFIKSATFMNESPFYYGFGSLLGEFSTTGESFFETGILVGYTRELYKTNLYYDLFLDLLITGGRINNQTSLYQAEAPALHLGLSIGFPATSDLDGALFVTPVIRPYNLQTGSWDFSRSYISFGLAVRVKSQILGTQVPWSETYKEVQIKGDVL